MLFLESDFSVKLISVTSPSWSENDTQVAARPYNAISFRLSGNAIFENGGVRLETQDSDILFMPEGVGYHLRSGAEKIIAVHFELSGKKQNFFEVFRPEKVERFRELFASLSDTWEGKRTGYVMHATSIFYRILEEIVKQNTRQGRSHDYDKIREAVHYLNKNFTDPALSVEELCKISEISDTYFRRLFMREFKMTPVRYLTEMRMNYAAELLESGYYDVEQVSAEAGFSDSKYFSRVFKEFYGKTPSEYKRDAMR